MTRFLACLLAWVTRVFSSAVPTTSRRGKPRVTIVVDAAFLQQLADDYARKARAQFGSSSLYVRTAPRPTAATTAVTTTTTIGGSPGPGWVGVGPFGMCIYPEKQKTRPDRGVDTQDPDAHSVLCQEQLHGRVYREDSA